MKNKLMSARVCMGVVIAALSGGCAPRVSVSEDVTTSIPQPEHGEVQARVAPEDLPDYAGLYRAIVDSVWQSNRRLPRHAFHGAVIAARLYEVSGNPEEGGHGRDLFREGLAAVTGQQEGHPLLDGFHEHRSFALACLDLQRLGLLEDADREALRPVVTFWLQEFVRSFEPGTRNQRTLFRIIQENQAFVDHNIRLANVLAAAALSRYLSLAEGEGSRELCAAVNDRVDAYWRHLMRTGDLDENASNYSWLGQAFLLDLACILDRRGDLADSESFKRMFTRSLYQVSPTGLLPEIGDSYFQLTPGKLDLCYVLEAVAVLYDDPTLLHIARDQFNGLEGQPLGLREEDIWYRGFGLIHQTFSLREPVTSQTSPSRVSYRNRRNQSDVEKDLIDKLVLKTGWTPGSAMIMMDLYASGSHSHLEKGPSIAYYEVAGVPLFHNMGRHGTRSATNGNLFWMQPEPDNFPGLWREDEWFTMTIPLSYLPKVGETEYRIGRDITFRNFQERNGQVDYLYFDNIRLDGPAGTLLLDGFEDASSWHRNVYGVEGVELVQSKDATQGEYSQRVNWSVLPSGFCTRLFKNQRNFNFSSSDYDTFKMDVKYVGQRPYINLRSVLETPIDLGNQVLPNTIASARTEQRGEDAYGEVVYSRYTVGHAGLTRRMVLTREGVLVIQDTFTPSPEMNGWTGGQLWQMYELADQGEDWFASAAQGEYPTATDGERRMLVKYLTDEETDTFVERIDQNYHQPNPKGLRPTEFFTTGSRCRMSGNSPQTFTMVIVPHSPDLRAAELAESIDFESQGAGSSSVILSHSELSEDPIRIDIGAASWSVAR